MQSGTSAGRVQSVAVRLICERENEIRAFVPEEYWTIEATLSKLRERQTFVATLIGRQGSAEINDATEDEPGANGANGANGMNGSNGANGANGTNGAREKRRMRITSGDEAQALLKELEGAAYVVLKVEQRDVRRQPFLPYTTSTLQQDASVRAARR